MPLAIDQKIVERVSKAKKQILQNWIEGASLQERSGYSIDTLIEHCIDARLRLSRDCLRRGKKLNEELGAKLYRDAISRFYYATYHAFRAVVYFHVRGDDFDDHSELPKHIPDDFPDVNIWKNNLKIARDARNFADYELSPPKGTSWKSSATDLELIATRAIADCTSYLRSKGLAKK